MMFVLGPTNSRSVQYDPGYRVSTPAISASEAKIPPRKEQGGSDGQSNHQHEPPIQRGKACRHKNRGSTWRLGPRSDECKSNKPSCIGCRLNAQSRIRFLGQHTFPCSL